MKQVDGGDVIRAGVLGALLGAAAGFAVGMLIAPEEGQKIRRRLAFQLENLSGQVGRMVEGLGKKAEEESAARQAGESVVNDARERADKIRRDIDSLLGEHRGTQESSAASDPA